MTFNEQLKSIRSDRTMSWMAEVGEYLKTREDISDSLESNGKSLKECGKYIMSIAKKRASQGVSVMDDREVYGLAVHYYDESREALEIDEPLEETVKSAVVHADVEEQVEKKARELAEKMIREKENETASESEMLIEKKAEELAEKMLEERKQEEKKARAEAKRKRREQAEKRKSDEVGQISLFDL